MKVLQKNGPGTESAENIWYFYLGKKKEKRKKDLSVHLWEVGGGSRSPSLW